MRRTEDGLIPTALAIAGELQWVASWGGTWLVSATTRSTVSAGSGAIREGRVLSRMPLNSLLHEALLPAPDHGLALANGAQDGRGALAIGGQNNDPRAPHVLLRPVAIPDDQLQAHPIRQRIGDGNSFAHHRQSHEAKFSETPFSDASVRPIHSHVRLCQMQAS